ncbi:MAG: manganese efflux pump [Acidobacteriota bacterium]|nr:manganese efflux pump [Acidobacteriota bacterium]
MGTVFIFGVLAGLDNLQVSAGIGMNSAALSKKWALVFAFAVFEGLMPLVGLLAGKALATQISGATEIVGPALLAACGLYVIIQALREKDSEEMLTSRWTLLGLPFALSLDNLMAGAGFGVMGYPVALTALIIGGISGCMCFIGVLLGDRVKHLIPARAELLSGVWLMAVAAFGLFFES